MNDISIFQSMVGKTIESIEINETFEDDVGSVVIKFTDGMDIDIGCSNYNYGCQHLTVSES
jgi:hypothetical protein